MTRSLFIASMSPKARGDVVHAHRSTYDVFSEQMESRMQTNRYMKGFRKTTTRHPFYLPLRLYHCLRNSVEMHRRLKPASRHTNAEILLRKIQEGWTSQVRHIHVLLSSLSSVHEEHSCCKPDARSENTHTERDRCSSMH